MPLRKIPCSPELYRLKTASPIQNDYNPQKRYWHWPSLTGKLHAADTAEAPMRFIPEQCSIIYSRTADKGTSSISGRWPLENPDLSVELEEERNGENPAYRFKIKSKEDIYIKQLTLGGRLDGTLRPVSILTEGFQSRSITNVLHHENGQRSSFKALPSGQCSPWAAASGKGGERISEHHLLLDDGLNESLLLAQDAPFKEFVFFEAFSQHQPVKIKAHWVLEKAVGAEEQYTSGWVSTSSGCAEQLLRQWSENSSTSLKNSVPPLIWSSGAGDTHPADPAWIRENVNTAVKTELPFDLVLIDSRWEKAPGDWLCPSDMYSDQLPGLAKEITAAGFLPGISIAPFIASRDSEAFRQPGWILCNEKGKAAPLATDILGKKLYALDISHPEVINYIRSCIRTITREWGFKAVKLDMLFAATLEGVHFDNARGLFNLFTDALSIIREAAGEDVMLIGSGMPLTTGSGYCDIAAVSCGDPSRWDRNVCFRTKKAASTAALQSAVRSSIIRSYYNKRFWHNDPGLLIVSDPQKDVLLTAALYGGGALTVGDDLTEMEEQSLNRLKQVLNESRNFAEGNSSPLRLFGSQEVFALFNDRGFIQLFNLNEEEVTIELRLSRYKEILKPYTAYKPFEGAEDHPLEAPRNMTLPGMSYKLITLS